MDSSFYTFVPSSVNTFVPSVNTFVPSVNTVLFFLTFFIVGFVALSLFSSRVPVSPDASSTPSFPSFSSVPESISKKKWTWSTGSTTLSTSAAPHADAPVVLTPATFQGYVTIPQPLQRHPLFSLAFRPYFVILYTLWEHGGMFTYDTIGSVDEHWIIDPRRAFAATSTTHSLLSPDPTLPRTIHVPTLHHLASAPRTPWLRAWIRECTRAVLDYPNIDFYAEEQRPLLQRYGATSLLEDLHANAVRIAAMVAYCEERRKRES